MAIAYISRASKVSIAVTTQPTTIQYFQGDTLDLAGIVVTATRRDGSTENVTSQCTFSPANGSVISDTGTITITITYHGVSTTTSVTSYTVIALKITTPPTKTVYNAGDTIDYTGIVVTAQSTPPINPAFQKDVTSECSFSPASGTKLSTGGTFCATISWRSYSATQSYTVNVPIYGAQWAGGSSPAWTRTDDAANFSSPSPAVSNGNGSSPFDNIMPWSGMVRETDSLSNVLVKIPKFYYKWTKAGSTIKLQIANAPVSGFSVSPAHANRGDGKGERDYVYVGAYHCCDNAYTFTHYRSRSGYNPITNITRATARTGIHGLGSTYWQWDYAMYWTINMLYLVEYANWDIQRKIGIGNGGSSVSVTGLTDSMKYHTGTNASSRSSNGHVRYRYIEDLWSNVMDFIDGATAYNRVLYVQSNPSNFSDSNSGSSFGTLSSSEGNIMTVSISNYALITTGVTTDADFSTYICDNYACATGTNILYQGSGAGVTGYIGGLFCQGFNITPSTTNGGLGCRLMKLP